VKANSPKVVEPALPGNLLKQPVITLEEDMAIAIRSTTIAAFASRMDAEQAIEGLLKAEFRPDQIGIVLPDGMAGAARLEQASPTATWAGSMFRSMIGVEIPEEEVRYYEEALEEGRTLVMVRSEGRYPEAMDLLYRCGGEYMAAY
jgi:hypothetical protein